ncbi:MAG: SDR family oxidoreductase [Flavobacteriales bacterium AspAUS03]
MDLGLIRKRAIVCASSEGLGRAVAEALAAEGCQLVINGRDPIRLEQAAEEIRRDHAVSVTTVLGSIDDKAVQDTVFNVCSQPDILITNNGGPPFKVFEALTEVDFISGFQSNALVPIMMIQRVLPGMRKRRFGRIVNIASVTVVRPVTGLDVSATARAGLVAGLRSAVLDCAGTNVTINTVLPGRIATRRTLDAIGFDDRQHDSVQHTADPMKKILATIPAHRLGEPAEFGALVVFLCGQQAGYITGQMISIDGGVSVG